MQITRNQKITPRHPQSHGMVERYNRTLKQQIALFVEQQHRDWDSQVTLLFMVYRTAKHDATKYTPAKVMFGRELRAPIDLAFGRPEPLLEATKFVEKLQENHDTSVEPPRFDTGDLVRYYNPRRPKKLSAKLRW